MQGHTIRQRTVSVLQEQLRQAGIVVDVTGLEPNALFERWSRRDYDASTSACRRVQPIPV